MMNTSSNRFTNEEYILVRLDSHDSYAIVHKKTGMALLLEDENENSKAIALLMSRGVEIKSSLGEL